MRNQKGITLVELLAALALVGLVAALAFSIMTQGLNASDRNTSNQRLQQEANIIVEKLRRVHLMNSHEAGYTPTFELEIIGNVLKIKGEQGGIAEDILSTGYTYKFLDTVDVNKMEIDRGGHQKFKMEIKDGARIYIIDTTFSKL
ncbi:prepilin-type N-terminal cleavage/methylation domain-containing protein [Paenisporosarcina sp. NPDC076898]|uniref:prepilin-type N-terminal cleavage/methylation domain-containing protein n=1 Tax=unclassified Paenisporosarcina TaxID=2642018 RepID=UPI003CFE33F8